MANGIVYGGTAQEYGGFRIVWWETDQDNINNRSVVNIAAQIYCPDSWNHYNNQVCDTNINGDYAQVGLPWWGFYDDYTTILTRSVTVPHDADGSKSCYIAASFETRTSLSTASASGTVTLDKLEVRTRCGAPTSVTATSSFTSYPTNTIPNGTVTVSWSGATSGTNNSLTGYDIYYKISTNGQAPTTSDYTGTKYISGTSTTSTSFALNNAPRGSHITFAVRARGSAGADWYSDIKSGGNITVNYVPSVPTINYPTEILSTASTGRITSISCVDKGGGATTAITYRINNGSSFITESALLATNFTVDTTYYIYPYDGIEVGEPAMIKMHHNVLPQIYSATMDANHYIANTGTTSYEYTNKVTPSFSVSEPGRARYIMTYWLYDGTSFTAQTPITVFDESISSLTTTLPTLNINDILKSFYNQKVIRYNFQIKFFDSLGESTIEEVYCGPNGMSNTQVGAGYYYLAGAPEPFYRTIDNVQYSTFNQFEMSNISGTRPSGHRTSFYNQVRLMIYRDTDINNYIINITQNVTSNGNTEIVSLEYNIEKITYLSITENNVTHQVELIDLALTGLVNPGTLTTFTLIGSNGYFNKVVTFELTSAYAPLTKNLVMGGSSNAVQVKPFSATSSDILISKMTWPFPLSNSLSDGYVTYECDGSDNEKIGIILSRTDGGNEYSVRRAFSTFVEERSSDILYGHQIRNQIFNFNYTKCESLSSFTEGVTYYEYSQDYTVINLTSQELVDEYECYTRTTNDIGTNIYTLATTYIIGTTYYTKGFYKTLDTSCSSSKTYYLKENDQNALGITEYYGSYNIFAQFYITNQYGVTYYSNKAPLILNFDEDVSFNSTPQLYYNAKAYSEFFLTSDTVRESGKQYYLKREIFTLASETLDSKKMYYTYNSSTYMYEKYNGPITPDPRPTVQLYEIVVDDNEPFTKYDTGDLDGAYERNNYSLLGSNKLQEGLYIELQGSINLYTNEDLIIDVLVSRDSGENWVVYRTYNYSKDTLSYGKGNQLPSIITFDSIDNNDGNPAPLRIGQLGEIMTSIPRQFKIRVSSKTRGIELGTSHIITNIGVLRHTAPTMTLNYINITGTGSSEKYKNNLDIEDIGYDSGYGQYTAKLQLVNVVGGEEQYTDTTNNFSLPTVPFADQTITITSTQGSDTTWTVRNVCMYLETKSVGGLLTNTKVFRTPYKTIYNNTPTVAYRSNQLGINIKDATIAEFNDGIVIINQANNRETIYVIGNDENSYQTVLAYSPKTGDLQFSHQLVGGTIERSINFINGKMDNFIIDCGEFY